MNFKKVVMTSLIALFLNSFLSYAETVNVSLRIRDNQSDEKIINKKNLFAIRQFIIKKGLRETWGNNPICADNPAYQTKKFSFWLKPNNMFNKSDENDFQTLVIRLNEKNPYCDIRFQDEFYIDLVINWPAEDLNVSQIRKLATDAINEILPEIKDIPEPNHPSKPKVDVYELQNAVDIAVSALRDKSSIQTDDYILIAARQIMAEGRYVWIITFKPLKYVPVDPSKGPMTFGGEIHIKVNINSKQTQITFGK